MSLYEICKRMSEATPGYSFGGGHSEPISKLSIHQRLDCSSSCSLALYKAGFFGKRTWSLSSWDFGSWGVPGYGKYWTVHYSGRHVWIQFHGRRRGYRRFDTSPWGSPGLGPRIRRTPRSKVGFKQRHWPGH